MKSLDQIEARTPISSLPFTINTGGSYYLTKSLNIASGDAITISASGVTVDLNGFEVTSTESSPAHSGILIGSGLANIRVMNGLIRGNVILSGNSFSGSGFANGILASGTSPVNVTISNVSVSGCLSTGIYLLGAGLVESCNVTTIGGLGINAATVIYHPANKCGTSGINAISVTGCSVSLTLGGDDGITGETVTNCTAIGNISSARAQSMRRLRATVMQWPVPGQATGCCPIQQKTVRVFQTGPAVEFMLTEARSIAWDRRTGAASENSAGMAFNCYGVAGNGSGISALSAENCYGVSNNAGYHGTSATNCYGSTWVRSAILLMASVLMPTPRPAATASALGALVCKRRQPLIARAQPGEMELASMELIRPPPRTVTEPTPAAATPSE